MSNSITKEDFEKARQALIEGNIKDDEQLYLHHTGALIASSPRGTRILSKGIENEDRS